MTFDPATGLLSGTPAVGAGAVYTLTATATNGVEPDAVQTFTLYVNEPPTITSADATTFVVGGDTALQSLPVATQPQPSRPTACCRTA